MASQSEIQGKTRVIPVPKWQADRNNALKKVKRLAEKVDKLCKEKGFPPMGFFYIHGGQINVYGHRKACEEIFSERNLSNLDPDIMEPECTLEETEKEENSDDNVVDLRNIDLAIDYSQVKVDDIRQIYSLMLFNKGKGERSTYTENRTPEFWPDDVPFVSHSKRREDGKRVLTADMMVKCLEAFKEYCKEKIKLGYKPVNISSSLDLAKLMNGDSIVRKEETEEKESVEKEELVEEDLVEKEESVEKEELVVMEEVVVNEELFKPETDEPIEEGDPRSVIDYVLDGNELGPEIIMAIKSTPLYIEYGTVGFQPRKKVLRSYNGPKELIPGEGQPSFWNIIHHFPDVARINLFLFANAHLSHYCCQYEANETSIQLLKETFSNTSSEAKTIEQLLKEETMHILTDAKPSLSTWMFFSGYMRATTTIYTQACGDPIHISACPCLEGDRQVYNFFQDKGETVYPLSPRSLWFANNLNTRRVVDEVEVSTSTDGPVGTLPGISHDDRNISRYGYIVYPDDIDRIKNGDWLDDSVINLCIRHLIEGHESSIQMLDSTFARKLMVPKQAKCLDDGSRLKFCTLNAEEGMIYNRRLAIQQLELIIIPICDNLHWFTVYLWPRQRKLQYICSMGGRNAKILNLLRTFFCEIMKIKESDISLEFPLVPKQQNGNDCGVFVILYANSMIKKGHMTVEGQGQRQQVLDILKEIRQLCD